MKYIAIAVTAWFLVVYPALQVLSAALQFRV